MGSAAQQENCLDITDEVDVFTRRTGLLWSQWQVEKLGFHREEISGMFGDSSVGMLLEFCAENPEYHIVSASCGRFENRYFPHKNVYMLAEGDNSPNLVLDMCLKKDPNLLMEEMLEEGLAINHSVDRGCKAK